MPAVSCAFVGRKLAPSAVAAVGSYERDKRGGRVLRGVARHRAATFATAAPTRGRGRRARPRPGRGVGGGASSVAAPPATIIRHSLTRRSSRFQSRNTRSIGAIGPATAGAPGTGRGRASPELRRSGARRRRARGGPRGRRRRPGRCPRRRRASPAARPARPRSGSGRPREAEERRQLGVGRVTDHEGVGLARRQRRERRALRGVAGRRGSRSSAGSARVDGHGRSYVSPGSMIRACTPATPVSARGSSSTDRLPGPICTGVTVAPSRMLTTWPSCEISRSASRAPPHLDERSSSGRVTEVGERGAGVGRVVPQRRVVEQRRQPARLAGAAGGGERAAERQPRRRVEPRHPAAALGEAARQRKAHAEPRSERREAEGHTADADAAVSSPVASFVSATTPLISAPGSASTGRGCPGSSGCRTPRRFQADAPARAQRPDDRVDVEREHAAGQQVAGHRRGIVLLRPDRRQPAGEEPGTEQKSTTAFTNASLCSGTFAAITIDVMNGVIAEMLSPASRARCTRGR